MSHDLTSPSEIIFAAGFITFCYSVVLLVMCIVTRAPEEFISIASSLIMAGCVIDIAVLMYY